ncbi:DUF2894 domain-containing protein [Paraburkholderia sp.]|uniref:DUF2894 domain-containing protein n=1 Tax=Paraburkholderia sp. TaxID=1926495 RepID=UPI002F3FA9C4
MSGHPARATLDAWRASGADRVDPLRFRFIEALARRAAGHSGAARRILDGRLSTLLDEYAATLGRADKPKATVASAPLDAPPSAADDATLAALIERLAGHARADSDGAAYPELPALDYFRDVWSKVRADKQLRQSLAPVAGNTGPLNSSSLVHRSLSLMRELSPGYLKQFLSYVDTLSWLEQMNGGAPAGKERSRHAADAAARRK